MSFQIISAESFLFPLFLKFRNVKKVQVTGIPIKNFYFLFFDFWLTHYTLLIVAVKLCFISLT